MLKYSNYIFFVFAAGKWTIEKQYLQFNVLWSIKHAIIIFSIASWNIGRFQ